MPPDPLDLVLFNQIIMLLLWNKHAVLESVEEVTNY